MSEINIYVKAIATMESPYYEFYTDSLGTTELTPTNTLYTNNTYIFNRLNNETSHPFFISDVGYEQESTSAITITVDSFSSGSVDYLNGIKNNERFQLEFNTLTSSDTLYYYCTSHSSMVSTFVLIDPPAAAIFNSYVNVNDNLIVTGNITLDGDISGSGSNLYDIPNSGLVNNSITINSQNVALGESVTLIASQWTTDSNAIYYDGGNVGIQTSDPSYALDVSGSVNCSELLVNGTAPSFGGDGSSYVQLDTTYVTPSETYANPDQNTISLETNNWNLDFLNNIYYNTGNVGIGVDTASFELDVSGSVNCTELLVNGTAPTFGGEYVLYDDTYQTSALDYREVSANISTTSSTTSSGVWDLSDSNTISYTNGNVGIGTTSPVYELDVSGNIYANENIYANGDMYIYGSHLRLDNSVTGATTGIHINMKHKDATHNARALLVHEDTPDILQINYGSDFDTVQINNTVFIDGSCGIGTTSPSDKLQVNGNARMNGLTVGNDGTLMIESITGNGGTETVILQTSIDNISLADSNPYTYPTSSSATHRKLMCLQPYDGRVGIGTTTPIAPLHVTGSTDGSINHSSGRRYFQYSNPAGTASTSSDSSTAGVGLYAESNIVTSGYIFAVNGTAYASDERIKKNIIDLEDDACLQQLNLLKPKRYNYKDVVNRGSDSVVGFIAQEVQEIIPSAVKLVAQYIPNIYSLATVNGSMLEFSSPLELTVITNGGKIKVYDIQDREHFIDVSSASTTTITLSYPSQITDDMLYENQIFVYGEEVSNFHVLKKEMIIPVAVGAIQELDRQVIQLKQEKDALQASHDSLKNELAELKALLQEKSVI